MLGGDHIDIWEHTAFDAASFSPSSSGAASAAQVVEVNIQEILKVQVQEIDPVHIAGARPGCFSNVDPHLGSHELVYLSVGIGRRPWKRVPK